MIKIILISSFHTSQLRGETFLNFAIPFDRLNHYISNIEYRQTSMYSSTNSTKNILDEINLPPSTYTEYIHQNMDNQQIFECQEIHQIPTISRQRVSERLLENRLRRIEIDFQREQ